MDEWPIGSVMTVAATNAPAPGWYPDPHGFASLRWWDGYAWTEFATPLPEAEPVVEPEPDPVTEAPPFTATVAQTAEPDPVVQVIHHRPPQEAAAPEPAAEADEDVEVPVAAPAPFTFRARPGLVDEVMEPDPEPVVETALPVYESPLLVIASPVAPALEAPEAVVAPAAVPAPEPDALTSPPPVPGVVQDDPPQDKPSKRSRRPGRKAAAGTAAVVVAAAGAAAATNVLNRDDGAVKPLKDEANAAAPAAAADKTCLKEWNTTASGDAAQLRVTLGQFEGALARVERVALLPGTLMQPDSCGLTVYDPSSDTHAVFVAGVKNQLGYLDVTAYPRSARYGWPRSASEANVTIRPDGSIRAR